MNKYTLLNHYDHSKSSKELLLREKKVSQYQQTKI